MNTFLARFVLVVMLAMVGRYASAQGTKPNIVFILADDLGWADLGCYGNTYIETPNLDRLANEGARFTQAYAACPVCSPTRISILTGKYPARTRLTNWLVGQRWPKESPLEPLTDWTKATSADDVTLAEMLKGAGYVTGHIGKWHLGGDLPPTAHGFDVNIAGGRWGTPPSYFSPYKNEYLKDGPEGEYLTDRLGEEAAKFIASNKSKPFFLQLWHYAPHIPLRAPEKLVEKYKNKRHPANNAASSVYAAMVESMDASIGRVIKALDEAGVANNTIILFTSDNGGLAVREGTPLPPTSNVPLRAGKGYLYEGGIREPLVVRWPGVVKEGEVKDDVVISTDWMKTFAELAGQGVPENADGVSILPVLKGTGRVQREAVYWHYPHYANQVGAPGGAVRAGDWKLIEWYEDGRLELFNLKEDVGEARDLAGERPEEVRRLRGMLARWRTSVGAQMPVKKAG